MRVSARLGRPFWVATAAALALALTTGAAAAEGPHYVVPPGYTRCPSAKALGGFFKWASVRHATCADAARFMRVYGAAEAASGAMPRRLRRFRCDIRYWRNADGDIFASRHACHRSEVRIRFYGMV